MGSKRSEVKDSHDRYSNLEADSGGRGRAMAVAMLLLGAAAGAWFARSRAS